LLTEKDIFPIKFRRTPLLNLYNETNSKKTSAEKNLPDHLLYPIVLLYQVNSTGYAYCHF